MQRSELAKRHLLRCFDAQLEIGSSKLVLPTFIPVQLTIAAYNCVLRKKRVFLRIGYLRIHVFHHTQAVWHHDDLSSLVFR